jgi:hypothetical protein
MIMIVWYVFRIHFCSHPPFPLTNSIRFACLCPYFRVPCYVSSARELEQFRDVLEPDLLAAIIATTQELPAAQPYLPVPHQPNLLSPVTVRQRHLRPLGKPVITPPPGTVTYVPDEATVYENGLLLSTGLTSRIIATTDTKVQYDTVGESSEYFHRFPDGKHDGCCVVYCCFFREPIWLTCD